MGSPSIIGPVRLRYAGANFIAAKKAKQYTCASAIVEIGARWQAKVAPKKSIYSSVQRFL
jgi:hypothetical protein